MQVTLRRRYMVHTFSSFVCGPDAKDAGEEAKDPGQGEWNNQMARAKILNPGEEPLIHWKFTLDFAGCKKNTKIQYVKQLWFQGHWLQK